VIGETGGGDFLVLDSPWVQLVAGLPGDVRRDDGQGPLGDGGHVGEIDQTAMNSSAVGGVVEMPLRGGALLLVLEHDVSGFVDADAERWTEPKQAVTACTMLSCKAKRTRMWSVVKFGGGIPKRRVREQEAARLPRNGISTTPPTATNSLPSGSISPTCPPSPKGP